eukprot:116570-Chlamydomonas_euryale.AAC.1
MPETGQTGLDPRHPSPALLFPSTTSRAAGQPAMPANQPSEPLLTSGDGAVRVLHPRAAAVDGLAHCLHRLALPDDALVQLVGEREQAVALILHQLGQRDACRHGASGVGVRYLRPAQRKRGVREVLKAVTAQAGWA